MPVSPRSERCCPDAAVSDLIGNVLLVGLTVALMAGAGLVLVTMAEPGETFNAQTRVRATSDTLTFTHAGGEPLRLGGATVVVTVDGTQQRLPLTDCPITPTGEPGYWEYAETVIITSPSQGCADWSNQELTSVQLVFTGDQDAGSLVASWDGSMTPTPAPSQAQDPNARFTHRCTELACDFTDISTDPDGTIQSWEWNFGGDGTSTEQHPSHTFSSAGTYDVKLKVTDDSGATDNHHENVTVTAAAPPGDPMHVHKIEHAEGQGPPPQKDLIATITIYDGSEDPLAGVEVCVEITRRIDGATFTDCATTDGNGEATITWVDASRDRYTTCVTSLTLSGFTWDTAADHASSGSCHTG